VPASEVGLLKQKHAEELRGLQTQADRAQELEMELEKAQEAESKLRLEFDQWLAKEKEILAAKYNTEVDELRTSQGVEIEKRDVEIRKLVALWGSTTTSMPPNLAFGVRETPSSTLVSKGWSTLFVVHFLLRFSAFAPLCCFPSHLLLLQRPSPILTRMWQPR
jgi:hypothetical protein